MKKQFNLLGNKYNLILECKKDNIVKEWESKDGRKTEWDKFNNWNLKGNK